MARGSKVIWYPARERRALKSVSSANTARVAMIKAIHRMENVRTDGEVARAGDRESEVSPGLKAAMVVWDHAAWSLR